MRMSFMFSALQELQQHRVPYFAIRQKLGQAIQSNWQVNGIEVDQTKQQIVDYLRDQGRVPEIVSPIFPEYVARVPVSLWGCGGELCSPDVAQPFTTVRNRPREDQMAVPMVSSAKGITFRVFQLGVASFRVAGVALCYIPTCFMTCQKWFCVAGTILLPRFQKMRCIFRGRHNTLETFHVILRGKRSTLDMSCCVFCESHCQRCAKW